VIGTAPGIQADLVVSSNAGGGIYAAALYQVETVLDPVMTISFGSCEAYAGASAVSQWDTLFALAASEGISVFVSSGDSGAAGCDGQFQTPPAYQFRSINYICASSYVTCVGGTEFVEGSTQYWSSTNGTGLVSALGYIPEGAWNEPGSFAPFVAASGGGGASIYVPKPAWQAGA
jgi:subtilase family serine protease